MQSIYRNNIFQTYVHKFKELIKFAELLPGDVSVLIPENQSGKPEFSMVPKLSWVL